MRTWLLCLVLAFGASVVGKSLAIVTHLEPVERAIRTSMIPLAEHIPADATYVGFPSGPAEVRERSVGVCSYTLQEMRDGLAATGPWGLLLSSCGPLIQHPMTNPVVVLIWHTTLCLAVAWVFRRWGPRTWRLHADPARRDEDRLILPHTIATAAWVSLAWAVIADVAHLAWFLPTVASEDHAPAWNLATGYAGVGGIWLGAAALQIGTIVWFFRRTALASRSLVADLAGLCDECGYSRPSGTVCPECGVLDRGGSRAGPAHRGVGVRRAARLVAMSLILLGLFASPLTLALGGRAVGMKNADAIATWWCRLLPPQ